MSASTAFRLRVRSGVRYMFLTSCWVSVEVPRTPARRVTLWSERADEAAGRNPGVRVEVAILSREDRVEDDLRDLLERHERAVLHLLVEDGPDDLGLEDDVRQRGAVLDAPDRGDSAARELDPGDDAGRTPPGRLAIVHGDGHAARGERVLTLLEAAPSGPRRSGDARDGASRRPGRERRRAGRPRRRSRGASGGSSAGRPSCASRRARSRGRRRPPRPRGGRRSRPPRTRPAGECGGGTTRRPPGAPSGARRSSRLESNGGRPVLRCD